jgi:hypothetical protein
MLEDLLHGALGDHVAPQVASAGTQVDDMIRGADGVLVVLHHDDGVAQVAQLAQGAEEPGVVPLMQSDAGLIEHVEHADQAGPDLRGETMRCDSPPDSVPALRPRVRYSSPTSRRNTRRSRISFRIGPAISGSTPPATPRPMGIPSKKATASSTGMSTTSPILRPESRTERLSGLSRRPPQSRQGISTRNSSSWERTASLLDS